MLLMNVWWFDCSERVEMEMRFRSEHHVFSRFSAENGRRRKRCRYQRKRTPMTVFMFATTMI